MTTKQPYDEAGWSQRRAHHHHQRPQKRGGLLLRLLQLLLCMLIASWGLFAVLYFPLSPAGSSSSNSPPPLKRLRHLHHGTSSKNASNSIITSNHSRLQTEDHFSRGFCSPGTLDASAIHYHRRSATFYAKFQSSELPVPPAPVFDNTHRFLCQEEIGRMQQWTYCLPITAVRDESDRCKQVERMKLLNASEDGDGHPICYASVLHMILVDVYEELRVLDVKPALLYGTLLGAVRDQAIIPYTEDGDIGFQVTRNKRAVVDQIKQALWGKGYHVFHHEVLRVCVAPTHPLASLLYDSTANLVLQNSVPYVDLYEMEREWLGFGATWRVQHARGGRVTGEAFQPYSQVQLLDQEFDTLADPREFLTMEYSADFLTPRPRK